MNINCDRYLQLDLTIHLCSIKKAVKILYPHRPCLVYINSLHVRTEIQHRI